MKKTISITENYGNKLKDELSSSGLRGEVTIQVKNKKTGDIESQQRHNLIVYSGREWLLRKAFASQIEGCDDNLLNSEILWFGVGNGGSEPGNPLQCGCVYGSDKDLYNPIRLRYLSDTNDQILNPYYASRIMPNGSIIPGYYKKITYVGIKEDQANPYKEYGIVKYPKLIAEIRLEISSDDCIGQSYLDKDYEKSYADINEAALFIADRRIADPGKDGHVSVINTDYFNYDTTGHRFYLEEKTDLPECVKDSITKISWTLDKPFPNTMVQYYDFYTYQEITDKSQADYVKIVDGITKYYKLINKINPVPVKMGMFSSGQNICTGNIILDVIDKKIYTHFENAESQEDPCDTTFTFTDNITSIDDVMIISHGTVVVAFQKNSKFETDNNVYSTVYYRNVYTEIQKMLMPTENRYTRSNGYRAYLPIGYVFNTSGQLVVDNYFTNNSIIRINETTNTARKVQILGIEPEEQSYQVKIYTTQSDITSVVEGQKFFFTPEGINNINYISETDPATVIQVYNPMDDQQVIASQNTPFFVIERKGMVKEDYSGQENPIYGNVYFDDIANPYTMFNRVSFSSVRMNSNREIIMCWKIYF